MGIPAAHMGSLLSSTQAPARVIRHSTTGTSSRRQQEVSTGCTVGIPGAIRKSSRHSESCGLALRMAAFLDVTWWYTTEIPGKMAPGAGQPDDEDADAKGALLKWKTEKREAWMQRERGGKGGYLWEVYFDVLAGGTPFLLPVPHGEATRGSNGKEAEHHMGKPHWEAVEWEQSTRTADMWHGVAMCLFLPSTLPSSGDGCASE